jgi:hypothetical protein
MHSFYYADLSGDILSVDPTTGSVRLEYRLHDTSNSWWGDQLRRFDSSGVMCVFGALRTCLYVGTYTLSGVDTVPHSTEILIEDIGHYTTVYYGIIDGGQTILAGGLISGVPFGSMTDVRGEKVDRVKDVTLDHPYPNPCNPNSTLRYSLPARGHVRLEVRDILGRQVAVLFDGIQEAGAHLARFDGAGLATGVYLCRLHAGGAARTERLLLMR